MQKRHLWCALFSINATLLIVFGFFYIVFGPEVWMHRLLAWWIPNINELEMLDLYV
jgi:hypothetical protein